MSDCSRVCDQLALQPSNSDADVEQHIAGCQSCASYQRQHQVLDSVLRAELFWEMPPALSQQVLSFVASLPASGQLVVRPQPKHWYVTTVYMLTLMATALSLLVAWQFLSMLVMQIGLGDALAQLLASPVQGVAYLSEFVYRLPESSYIIALFLRIRDQLMWVMLVAVLWAALDTWSPHLGLQGQQVSS